MAYAAGAHAVGVARAALHEELRLALEGDVAGGRLSLVYQPAAMRWRGLPVYANSPLRSAQRGPGYNQLVHIIEPLIDKAARELKVDRLQMRLLNGPGLSLIREE